MPRAKFETGGRYARRNLLTQAFFATTNMTATGYTPRLFGTGSGALLSTAATAYWTVGV